jgi:hypothetical protein
MSKTFRDSRRAKWRKSRKERWDNQYRQEEYLGYLREYSFETHTWCNTGALILKYVWLKKPGGPKKPRNYLDQGHYWYLHTPGWFVNLYMTRRKRRACRMWENEAVTIPVDLLDTLDCPDYGRKPHIYYY